MPIKDVAQQDIQALHRVRERLMGERTALVNEVHGLLHEYGIVIPKGVAKCRQAVVSKLESAKEGIRVKRDSRVAVVYAEGLNSTTSSVTLQRTDRHGILGQKSTDFQESL